MKKLPDGDLASLFSDFIENCAGTELSEAAIRLFRSAVHTYYKTAGRTLPWRTDLSPYSIFISEIMLQQTQVERVIPKYQEWMAQFPDFTALAQAPVADVLRVWQGLGYNRRALYTKRAAERVIEKYGGTLPQNVTDLRTLPGIGEYTASAITAFAFNRPAVLIETNIRTVFIYFFFPQRTDVADRGLLPVIEKTQDTTNPREWYWALMDLGSYIKSTAGNLSRNSKHYTKQSPLEGSKRQLRGMIITALTRYPKRTEQQLIKQINRDRSAVMEAVTELIAEGFLEKVADAYALTR